MRTTRRTNVRRRLQCQAGFTFVELLVASGIAAVLIAVILALYFYGEQSFALMTNYSELDAGSRNAVTLLSDEIREATQVIQAQTNSTGKSLTLSNAIDGIKVKLVWDSTARTLSMEKPTRSAVLLNGCDSWNYVLYDGAPVFKGGDITFTPSASVSTCKLVEMSWSCSRTVLGKAQASSVECVRFGLRNPHQ